MSDSVQEKAGSLNHGTKVGAAPALAECNGTYMVLACVTVQTLGGGLEGG